MSRPTREMSVKPAPAPGEEIVLFDRNDLLPRLVGAHDSNLRRLERDLNVVIAAAGGRFVIRGPARARARARRALAECYARLAQARDPAEEDLPAARSPPAAPRLQTPARAIVARSKAQAAYMQALAEGDLIFALGPAGCGKTYLAVCAGAAALAGGEVAHLILSRPAVEAGERLGFLPGDMREKIDPYLRPLWDALHDALPPAQVARAIQAGQIEIAPLAFMRGRTLDDAFVILDEAQNSTPAQMKMFLTRLGPRARMVITGDPSQTDLPAGQACSGLDHAVRLLQKIPAVRVIRFAEGDIMRHELVGRIVRAYAQDAAP